MRFIIKDNTDNLEDNLNELQAITATLDLIQVACAEGKGAISLAEIGTALYYLISNQQKVVEYLASGIELPP